MKYVLYNRALEKMVIVIIIFGNLDDLSLWVKYRNKEYYKFIHLFIYLFNKAFSLNNLVSNSTIHSLVGSLIQFAFYMNECCMNN